MTQELTLFIAIGVGAISLVYLLILRYRKNNQKQNMPAREMFARAYSAIVGVFHSGAKAKSEPGSAPLNVQIGWEQDKIVEPVREKPNALTGTDTVHVNISIDIPVDTIAQITIHAVNEQGKVSAHQEIIQRPALASRIHLPGINPFKRISAWVGRAGIDKILFALAILIYLLAVSIGIERFPIYFFTDEAVHVNLAADFMARAFTGPDGTVFPTYFVIDPSFSLNGVSVYLQVIPYLLFGKSIIVTRMVSGLITLLGAVTVSLLLKQVFKIKSYWLGILLLITSPAWFLHARTAFEYMEVASFFAAMLYFYNRYRQGEDKYLYATILAAGLTFYTHGLGQVLAGLTGLFFFLSDFRYHFQPQRRRTLLLALGLIALIALPYLRFSIDNPSAITAQIHQRGSYWVNANYTFTKKMLTLLSEYSMGINPLFWYFPNSRDLIRHQMFGYGNILWVTLPFAMLGIVRAIKNFRQSEYRTILIALLLSPIPAAVVAIGTPRVLWMIVPWVIMIALGLDWGMEWISSRQQIIPFKLINLVLFILLALTSVYMLQDALVKGSTWFTDYGLYGMQYGAKQVFQDTVVVELQKNPNATMIVSPNWTNGADQLTNFFIPKNLAARMSFGSPKDLIRYPEKMTANTFFITTASEFNDLSKEAAFNEIQVYKIIQYPDGTPGFYLLSLKFADNIDQIMAADREKRRNPVEDITIINGQETRVIHSPLGSGRLEDVFDNNPDTLTRVMEANPFLFDIHLTTPLDTRSVEIQTGSLTNFTVTIALYTENTEMPFTYTQTFLNSPPDPQVTMLFDKGPAQSTRITLEIKDNTSGETSQIHVRTVNFK